VEEARGGRGTPAATAGAGPWRRGRGAEEQSRRGGGGSRWRRLAAGVAAAEGRTQQFRGEMRENSGLEAHRLAASFD